VVAIAAVAVDAVAIAALFERLSRSKRPKSATLFCAAISERLGWSKRSEFT
jgi:uncharacterized membrane protein